MAVAFLLDRVLWHLSIFLTLFYGNCKYSRPCFMAKSPQKDPVSPEHRDHDHMGVLSPGLFTDNPNVLLSDLNLRTTDIPTFVESSVCPVYARTSIAIN